VSASAFECIYCPEGTSHDSAPSEAHCFPDAMGGVSSTKDKVCRACNNQINNDVENYVIQRLEFFQSIWGIESRRGNIPRVQAILKFGGRGGGVSLDRNGQSTGAIVTKNLSDSGAVRFSVVGPADKVEVKKGEIQEKFPKMQWVEQKMDVSHTPESMVKIELDLTGNQFRRLAAKVAFERFSQIRSRTILQGEEFDHIRAFIRDGKETYLCCGLLSDLRLLNGSLNFPIPNHGVVLIAHPNDKILGAFVTFYGLFPYWVLLSKRHTVLVPFDDLLLEYPQWKTTENPVLRQNIGSLRVNWEELIREYAGNEMEAVRIVSAYVKHKMSSALDEFYGAKRGNS
jgi:hypothetical protein